MLKTANRLQLTLALLKPDVTANPIFVEEIHQHLLKNHFYFVRTKQLKLNRERVKLFYKEHKERFFYNRLTCFMSSGTIFAHILARDDAIRIWRQMMGPTKVFKTVYEMPNSIRGRFGLTDTRNCTHGSDSTASALKEMEFFFPEFDAAAWLASEEPLWRLSEPRFDDDLQRLVSDRYRHATALGDAAWWACRQD